MITKVRSRSSDLRTAPSVFTVLGPWDADAAAFRMTRTMMSQTCIACTGVPVPDRAHLRLLRGVDSTTDRRLAGMMLARSRFLLAVLVLGLVAASAADAKPTPEARCLSAKLKAVAKKAAARLACHAKAARKLKAVNAG